MNLKKELKIISGFCLVWLCFSLSGGAQITSAQFPEEGRKHEQATREAFEAATLIVIGRKPQAEEVTRRAYAMVKNPATKNQIVEGVKFPEAVAFLKKILALPENKTLFWETINNAFIAVYGVSAKEQLKSQGYIYNNSARNWWFAKIYQTEKEILIKYPVVREKMINDSFFRALGRAADADEMKKWKPKPEVSHEIVENLRQSLYSKEGGTELYAVVTRYIESLPKDQQANVNINETVKQFKSNKWIYADVAK